MQRIKRIVLGVVIGGGALTGLIWVLIHTLGDHEATYRGKSFESWMDQLHSSKPETSNEVRLVLEAVVIPQLISQMFSDTNDLHLRLALIEQLNGLPGVNIRLTPADGRRALAAQSLGRLGPRAKAAIPSLVNALKGTDSAIRGAAAKALGEIGLEPESVIPLLIASVDDPQDGVPEAAVEALGDFGSLSKAAVPKLLPLLRAPDKGTRHAANVAIRKIEPSAVGSKASAQNPEPPQ